MLKSLCGRNAKLWTKLEHSAQQLKADRINLWKNVAQVLSCVDREVGLVLGKLGDTRPRTLRRSAHETENLLQLVFIGGSREQGTTGIHLSHDATSRPNVDRGVVSARAQQDVRGTVPECDDLVTESVDGNAESACKTKVSELELTLVVDQQVLRLEIAMEDSVIMAEGDTAEQLVHEGLDGDGIEHAALTPGIHVFLQILVHEFKDQHELVLGVNDIVETDYVFVLKFLHK